MGDEEIEVVDLAGDNNKINSLNDDVIVIAESDDEENEARHFDFIAVAPDDFSNDVIMSNEDCRKNNSSFSNESNNDHESDLSFAANSNENSDITVSSNCSISFNSSYNEASFEVEDDSYALSMSIEDDEDDNCLGQIINSSNKSINDVIDLDDDVTSNGSSRFSPLSASTQISSTSSDGREKSGTSRLLSCPFCAKCLKSSSELSRHVALKHKPKKSLSSLGTQGSLGPHRRPAIVDYCSDGGLNSGLAREQSQSTVVIESKEKTRCSLEKIRGFTEIRGRNSITPHSDYTSDPRRPFLCPDCDVRCTTRGHLQQHIEGTHQSNSKKSQKKVIVRRCPKCPFQSNNHGTLRRHVKLTHVQDRHVWCKFCGMDLKSSANLKEHKMKVHGDLLKFKCDFCDYRTSNEGFLKNHKRIKHLT